MCTTATVICRYVTVSIISQNRGVCESVAKIYNNNVYSEIIIIIMSNEFNMYVYVYKGIYIYVYI